MNHKEVSKESIIKFVLEISAQTVRIEPPLAITREQIDAVLDRLEDVLKVTAPGLS